MLLIFAFTGRFACEELQGLFNRWRKPAVSIPGYIVESVRKREKAGKARFMNMAEGSFQETRIILAEDLCYAESSPLMNPLEQVSRMLNAFAKAILASSF